MKKITGWLRSNWLIGLMCVVILAAPVGFFFGASAWNKSIQTSREAEAKADYDKLSRAVVTYSVPASMPGDEVVEVRRVPHKELTAHFAALRERQNEQIERVVEEATALNQAGHDVIVEGLLPKPPDREEQILRLEMLDRIVGTPAQPSVLQVALDGIEAGTPPDANEVARQLEDYRTTEIERHEAETGERNLSEEEAQELTETLRKRRVGEYQRRADEISVYGGIDVMPAEPTGFPRTKDGQAPELTTCFEYQWNYWIVQDLLKAVATANTDAGGALTRVPRSAVKRIVSIGLEFVPGLYQEGPQVGKVSSSGPLIGLDPSVSVTGRVSHENNQLYDVRTATLSLVVASARLPEVLEAIAATNFMSVVDMDVREIDPWEHLRLGYYYGDEHVVEVDLSVETVWLRSWTVQYMPETVRKLLRVREGA